jgi:hypothetical protein
MMALQLSAELYFVFQEATETESRLLPQTTVSPTDVTFAGIFKAFSPVSIKAPVPNF